METYYFAKKKEEYSPYSVNLESSERVFKDPWLVPAYQKQGYDCYLISELKKIIEFETLLIYEQSEELKDFTPYPGG